MSFRLLVALVCMAGGSCIAVPAATAAQAASVSYPSFAASPEVARSPAACAVNVAGYVAALAPSGDNTAAFTQAMADAVERSSGCYATGPSGAAQAVLYVPPGTYRLAGLRFPSNLRMEVSAGATLQLPANRPATPSDATTSMISWDSSGGDPTPLQNVTIIGVGRNLDAGKRSLAAHGGGALAPFDLSHDFTMNLDPDSTGSTNYNPGINLANVQYFQISDLLTIQNSTNQPNTPITNWPTSSRAVVLLHARLNSPMAGPYLQPKNGLISNQVNVGSPRGYGPNQVNGANYVTFQNIYSSGGTTLRLETDGSTDGDGSQNRGATVDHLTARNVVGVNCNRAVSLSPHAQTNGTVDISGVWAYSCNQAVVAAFDAELPGGQFSNAKVMDVHVFAGTSAQLDSDTSLWEVGQSFMPIHVDPEVTWNPRISVVESSGTFTSD